LGGSSYSPLYYSYGQAFGNPSAEIGTSEYAGYVNDDWRILPNLTLTLGARYEYEYVPANPFRTPAIQHWSPRLPSNLAQRPNDHRNERSSTADR